MFNNLGNKPSSQQQIQQSNTKLVFKLIYKNDGISRASIASITKLSPTTISSLTEQLIKKELIVEVGTKIVKNSGRRPTLLDVNKKGAYSICIDLQEKGYNIGIYDLQCNSVKENFVEVSDYSKLGFSLVTNITTILKEEYINESKMLGICIGAPGLIDNNKEKVISSTIIPIDENNDFYMQLKKRFNKKPIEVVNESSLAAYAEKQFIDEIKNINNILYVDIHTGIGAGIIIDGKIFRGANNLAGEFGHISVDINGARCKCGAKGCLETVANIKAILKQLKTYKSIEEVANRYEEGYVDVKVAVSKNAKYIAYGINNAVNLLNPEAVIIGGKITLFGQKYLMEVLKVYNEIALDKNKDIKILLSRVKGNPITLGGAKYLLDTILMR